MRFTKLFKSISTVVLVLAIACAPLAGCSGESPSGSSSAHSSSSAAVEQEMMSVTLQIDPTLAEGSYEPADFEEFAGPVTLELPVAATAYNALASTDLILEGQPSFITSINGLGSGAAGQSSGWMYKVNDETPMVAADEYVLEDGDALVWYYGAFE